MAHFTLLERRVLITETAELEGASDGEEAAWLVAMEKGQLDETGYLPQKPGTALTARQVN